MPRHTDNLEAIHAAYRAFRARDLGGLLEVLDPGIEWVHPLGMAEFGLGGTKSGHAGVKQFLARVPLVLGGMRLEPQEFIESGDRVVVFGVRQVTSVTGHTETLDFIHSWTMRDGRAVRMEDVFDTVLFHRLIRAEGPMADEPADALVGSAAA
ncbi:nuclear transport factor 2 family protein [Streptomyces syringium]|uniref:nuclear transport factor 2 family protein n=1 Tax=Streptomyces syringium TaxID=76729 RepID=UPI0036A29FFF